MLSEFSNSIFVFTLKSLRQIKKPCVLLLRKHMPLSYHSNNPHYILYIIILIASALAAPSASIEIFQSGNHPVISRPDLSCRYPFRIG